MKRKKAPWKPSADLIVRPRKTTSIYKLQLIKIALFIDQCKVVLVWTKWPAKLITDLYAVSGIRAFSIVRPQNFYYICKMEAQCPLTQ